MTVIKLPTLKLPKSLIAEAYRTLRTNIHFSSVYNRVKTIVVTSSSPAEGKTTVACNLAITTAQAGKRTLLIDCDMRRPKIQKVFGISNLTGLSDILVDEMDLMEVVACTDVDNLYVLPAGTIPPNPAELLSSEKMRNFLETISKIYDCIILDTPPILIVTDAQILSKYADGCLLVIAFGQVKKAAVLAAKELLDKVDAKMIGAVINKFEVNRRDYQGYYFDYYYEGKRKKHKKKTASGISIITKQEQIPMS